MMGDYVFTGPVNPNGGISADLATNIGNAIGEAYQQGLQDAGSSSGAGMSDFLTQHQTAIIAGAAALLLLAFVSSMRR